jgi:four helix bundle protein
MFSYQKLEVYNRAFLLNKSIYRLIKNKSQIPSYVKNQLGRASLSVILNIAEGSAKFSNKDRSNFFVTARGSIFECASIIEFLQSEDEISLGTMRQLNPEFEEISKMLFAMIRNLEKNNIN